MIDSGTLKSGTCMQENEQIPATSAGCKIQSPSNRVYHNIISQKLIVRYLFLYRISKYKVQPNAETDCDEFTLFLSDLTALILWNSAEDLHPIL